MARAVIGALRVTLGLDSAEFESGIKRASRTTQTFTRASKDVESASSRISSSLNGLKAALGISSIAAAGVQYLKLADESKQLSASLKLATAQFGNFSQAQRDAQAIAANTRSGLSETAGLYASFMRATKELGGQQFEAARATETFAKSLKISGASQAEAASATTQFGQALASGVLRGDEFNSIMESSPRLARLLADSLGVPIGALRKMAEEGELTADKLFRALTDQKFTAGIDAEFKQIPPTFDDAMTQVRTAALNVFGGFDRGGEFSSSVTSFITDGVNGFGDLGAAAERMGLQVRHAIEEMTATFQPFLDAAAQARQFLVTAQDVNPYKITPQHVGGFVDGLTSIVRAPLAASSATANLFYGKKFGDSFSTFMSDTSIIEGAKRSDAALQKKLEQANYARILAANPLADAPRVASTLKPAVTTAKKGAGAKGPSEETLRKRAQAEADRAADALRRFTDDLAREQSDLASTLADLTGSIESRRDAEIGQIETERQVRERAIAADDRIDAAKKQQLVALNDQNANARKELVRSQAAEQIAERSLRIDQDRTALATELLGLGADAARTARERREVELRILDAQFEQERRALEVAAASKDLAEATRARERLAALPEIQAGARSQVMRQTQGPMEEYLSRLPKTADEAREALERVQVDGIDGIIDGLAQAGAGMRSLGDVFKNVAQQIIADLIRIQIQKAVVGGLGKILGLSGGSSGAASLGAAIDIGGIKSLAAVELAGAREKGGPVRGGFSYLVGEAGPEIFTPERPGRIIPNGASLVAETEATCAGGGVDVIRLAA